MLLKRQPATALHFNFRFIVPSCGQFLLGAGLADTLFPHSPLPRNCRSDTAPKYCLSGRRAASRIVWFRRRDSRCAWYRWALNQVSLKTRLKTLFDLPRAVWDARGMLTEFRPDVVIGVGGYASGPAMLAAVLKRIPTLAFEPNVVPGFANRIVARMVSGAAVHFEETAQYFPHAVVTGVPVREAFFKSRASRPQATSPTLLVFGGSQGANAINQAMIQCLPELVKQVPNIHIIHQTGERGYNDAQAAYRQAGSSAEVFPFITDMPAFFARADLILCRSGASTVAEITAAGKPAVFVPFPRALTIIRESMPRRWSGQAPPCWWRKPSWSRCGSRILLPRCWAIREGCSA